MSTQPDLDKLAKSLTAAQRAYLTVKAEFRFPGLAEDRCWMTFPPANTHRALMALNLVDGSGRLTPLGLALRNHLKQQESADGR